MTPDELKAMLKEHLEISVSIEDLANNLGFRHSAVVTTVTFMGEVVAKHEGDIDLDPILDEDHKFRHCDDY